jgi:hypothetical protein
MDLKINEKNYGIVELCGNPMQFLKYCVPKDQHNNLQFWESAKCENEKSKKEDHMI